MMKKYLVVLLALTINLSFGQKLYKKDLLALQKKVYKLAIQNYDLEAAKNSVYQILAIEGEQSVYQDSLAYIYFNQKNYVSYITVADKILAKSEKMDILERKAIALENLGAIKEAVTVYEKVFAKKKIAVVAYKLGKLQHQLKRSAEAFATLRSMENEKVDEKALLSFPGAKKGQQQSVPLKAAYMNLLGMVSYDLHSYEMAIKYFNAALKVYPDFFVAKQNKAAIEVMLKKLQTNNKAQAPK
jgi:tetratricopeptide (TPR) repeat protein